MSVFRPPDDWWYKTPVDFEEKVWIGVALVWCLAMFAAMVGWAVWAKQNPPKESYRTTPKEFARKAVEFIRARQAKDAKGSPLFEKGIPVVDVPQGEDGYLIAKAWAWEPVLRLKKGQPARIRMSSLDFQHGFSLQPANLNLQILPGYEYVATLTPTSAGEFLILCNEFCGKDHHKMVGKIIVTE